MQAAYFYNQNDQWALDFWEEAVKKCPELVEEDFKSLNEFCLNDEETQRIMGGGFELNETYKEMFKNLNIK